VEDGVLSWGGGRAEKHAFIYKRPDSYARADGCAASKTFGLGLPGPAWMNGGILCNGVILIGAQGVDV
jgi:hypothetical protein